MDRLDGIFDDTAHKLDLAKRLPKNKGYNACIAIDKDNRTAGLYVKNEHDHAEISSAETFLFSSNDNALVLESKNEHKKGPSDRNTALLFSDNIRFLSNELNIYTEDDSLRWMNGFLNPDLNIAFKYNNALMETIGAGAGKSSKSILKDKLESKLIDQVYKKALMMEDYHLATFNPVAIGILQGLITELPKHFEKVGNVTEHVHTDFTLTLKKIVKEAILGIADDGTVPTKTGSLSYNISPPSIPTENTQIWGMPVSTTKNVSSSIDNGTAKVGGKLLFKKPEKEYFSSIPETIRNKISEFAKESKKYET